MRFVLVVLIWVVLLGGLRFYILQRDAALPPGAAPPRPAAAAVGSSISIELTPTFSTEEDPFALRLDDREVAPLQLRLNGSVLPLPPTGLDRGRSLVLKDLGDIRLGRNEVQITTSPPMAEIQLEHAVRVRIFAGDNTLLTDQTLWAGGGSLVSGTIEFDYTAGNSHGN